MKFTLRLKHGVVPNHGGAEASKIFKELQKLGFTFCGSYYACHHNCTSYHGVPIEINKVKDIINLQKKLGNMPLTIEGKSIIIANKEVK